MRQTAQRDGVVLATRHPSGATELHLAMTRQVMEELGGILRPPRAAPRSERGVIGIVHASSGRWRRSLLLRRVVAPAPGEVTFDWEHGLRFAPAYKSRATDIAAAEGAGLMFLHTHPFHPGTEHRFPHPSPADLESDRRDLFALGRTLAAGAPLVAGILSDAGLWSVREYTFRFPATVREVGDPHFGAEAGVMTYASAVRVVGPGVRKLPTGVRAHGPGGAEGAIAPDAQDSTVRLWGEDGQRALASLRVGHAGVGGVGGILAEHTARLGVGESVFLDYDRLTAENFNRSQGAVRREAGEGALKVAVAERVARAAATAPHFDARAVEGSVVEATSIADLLDCDIILNAADSPWARQVLDHLAFAHLIPVIHGGTVLRGDPNTGRVIAGKSEVSATGPGHACSECAGVYTLADVTEAQEAPAARGRRRYVEIGGTDSGEERADPRAPSVIAFNALVAGLMQLRLLGMALGTTPHAIVGAQRYHVPDGVLDWAPRKACKVGCRRAAITGSGDSYALPTGRDLEYEEARTRWARRATG